MFFIHLTHFWGNLNFQSCYHLLLGKLESNLCSSLFTEFHAFCSWIISNQWIFLGWPGLLHGTTLRGCGIDYGSRNSSCTRSTSPLSKSEEKCYCDEDLCNTGNWDRELSYSLMGITIGFQIVIKCLVV